MVSINPGRPFGPPVPPPIEAPDPRILNELNQYFSNSGGTTYIFPNETLFVPFESPLNYGPSELEQLAGPSTPSNTITESDFLNFPSP